MNKPTTLHELRLLAIEEAMADDLVQLDEQAKAHNARLLAIEEAGANDKVLQTGEQASAHGLRLVAIEEAMANDKVLQAGEQPSAHDLRLVAIEQASAHDKVLLTGEQASAHDLRLVAIEEATANDLRLLAIEEEATANDLVEWAAVYSDEKSEAIDLMAGECSEQDLMLLDIELNFQPTTPMPLPNPVQERYDPAARNLGSTQEPQHARIAQQSALAYWANSHMTGNDQSSSAGKFESSACMIQQGDEIRKLRSKHDIDTPSTNFRKYQRGIIESYAKEKEKRGVYTCLIA